MVDDEQDDPKDGSPRRTFLKFMGLGLLRTGAVAGVNVGMGVAKHYITGRDDAIEERVTEMKERLADDTLEDKLEVKDFSLHIMSVASNIVGNFDDNMYLRFVGGWFAGDAIGGYLLHNKSSKTNSAVGAAGMAIGKTIDLVSTYIAARHAKDPRFKEYGFESFVFENNPLLPNHPGIGSLLVLGIPSVVLGSIICWFLPSIGRGYAGLVTGGLAENNYKIGRYMLTCLELGDRVKKKLSEGNKKDDIFRYLYDVSKKKEY